MDENLAFNPNLILPVGTQVVTRVESGRRAGEAPRPRGAVGVVVEVPLDQTHAYTVRFADGGEGRFRRGDLAVRRRLHDENVQEAGSALEEYNLYDYVIYRCVVGSKAYGLDDTDSDADRRGIYLPPADAQWSLYGVPEQLENPDTEECYWELGKFVNLALKANPNILECLYTPLVEKTTPLAAELLAMRSAFLSRLVYQTYNGYVMSQFKKLEGHLRNKGAIKWKHAMHLVRLLLSGVTVLREGSVPLRIDAHRDRLLAIRKGEVPWPEVNRWRLGLHKELDAAFAATRLAERPDYERANAFLLKARRSML